MAKDKPLKYNKLVDMWFQAFFYSFIITIIFNLFGYKYDWNLRSTLAILLPTTFNKFWYFTAYFGLFLVIPLLNKFLFSITEKTSKITFIITIFLASFLSILNDAFCLESGYSMLWLIVLYCIGVLAKRIGFLKKINSFILIVLWVLCIFVTWGLLVFIDIGRLVNYISPTILLSGIIMVVLFSRIKLKGNIISKLSPLAFGIYLFQMSPIIWGQIIGGAFTFVVEKPIVVGVCYVVLFAFAIFASGLIVEFIRSTIAKLIRLPKLSEKIIQLITFLINKFIKIFRCFFN